MLFNNWLFVFYFILTMALYYAPFLKKFQVWTIIISSFIFYGFNKPVLCLLLLLSISLIALFSHAAYYRYKGRLFMWATMGVIVNLFILSLFKYSGLFFKTFLSDLSFMKTSSYILTTIPLPIGISFFTFEGISLIVDIFRRNEGRRGATDLMVSPSFWAHLKNTAVFISFFPHLVAGPIIKAHDFFLQITIKHFADIDWEFAFKTLVTGYFLKSVIADNLKDLTFWISYPYFTGLSSLTLVTLLFGFSVQIFSDFAGYSLIAIGLATLLGYRLPVNFNFPYIAKSFSDFWMRWHISLSSWLKEYLYIPLGGNRKGRTRTYFNVLMVMFLGGLWHGAAWSYAVWGIWHGILLMIERLINEFSKPAKETFLKNILKTCFVFMAVTVSWLFFKLPEFSHVVLYFKSIFKNYELQHNAIMIKYTIIYSLPVFLYHIHYLLKKRFGYSELLKKGGQYFEYAVYAMLVFLIVLNSGSANDFIYFQF